MKSLYKSLGKPQTADSNLEVIRAYVIADGEGIELSDQQKELKARIEFADEQIRGKNGILKREAIANIIRHRFECSRDTAFRYMRWAEDIYSSSNPLNKEYLISLRIDWCQQQAQLAAISGDMVAAAMFESCIAKYIAQYPNKSKDHSTRKNVFVFPVLPGQQPVTEEAAMEVLSSFMNSNPVQDGE